MHLCVLYCRLQCKTYSIENQESANTIGLVISYSGYSEEALNTFALGRTVMIIIMTLQRNWGAEWIKNNQLAL
mgnify:CR=1 FL=1